MITAISPDEVTAAPGKVEAAAIREDYAVAMKGMRAFVSMGLRLMDVKARLPHGQYVKWCELHLKELSARHLHRAKAIAEGLCEVAGLKSDACVRFENLPAEILEIIDGASEAGGYRSLLAAVQEYRHDELEAKNRALCEQRWAADAELRDEWEPRVLSGELTYTHAMRGMTGQELEGKPRPPINYSRLILRNLTSQPECWKHWNDIPDDQRSEVLTRVPDLIDGAPLVVLETLRKELERRLSAAAKP